MFMALLLFFFLISFRFDVSTAAGAAVGRDAVGDVGGGSCGGGVGSEAKRISLLLLIRYSEYMHT